MSSASRLRVLVEGHNLSLSRGTGIATYSRTLADGLRAIGLSPETVLDVDAPAPAGSPTLEEVALFDAFREPPWLIRRAATFAWRAAADPFGVRMRRLPRPTVVVDPEDRFHHRRFDAVHAAADLRDRSMQHFGRYGVPLTLRPERSPDILHLASNMPLQIKGVPTITTVHDVIPLRLPQSCLDDKRDFYLIMSSLLKRSARIIAVSEHTRRDLIEIFRMPADRISVTHQPYEVHPSVAALTDDHVADIVDHAYGLDFKNYFIFVGAIEPKKNVRRLVHAHAQSGTRRPLIIVGAPGWQCDEDIAAIDAANGGLGPHEKPRVRWLNYLPRQTMMALIRGARAMLFPSLYEGFGLPVLEAMALGTAVMTSNTSSLPEIAGDAAELVDPYSITEMAAAIRRLGQSGPYVQELAEKGLARATLFSPDRYAERLAEAYRF